MPMKKHAAKLQKNAVARGTVSMLGRPLKTLTSPSPGRPVAAEGYSGYSGYSGCVGKGNVPKIFTCVHLWRSSASTRSRAGSVA